MLKTQLMAGIVKIPWKFKLTKYILTVWEAAFVEPTFVL